MVTLLMAEGATYSRPNNGLGSLGFKVTRARVREAMRASDPINTALRWREITPRQPYSVPGPNSLWHIGI